LKKRITYGIIFVIKLLQKGVYYIIMDKTELAKEIFATGANCCQAVVLAFKDELGVDELTLKKLSIGLGGGVARQRLVCGAVSGMVMVLGYLKSDGKDKLSAYSAGQKACEKFKQQVGSLICSDLLSGKVKVETSPKPDERTEEYYKKRPCSEMVALAVQIAEEIINQE